MKNKRTTRVNNRRYIAYTHFERNIGAKINIQLDKLKGSRYKVCRVDMVLWKFNRDVSRLAGRRKAAPDKKV